MPHETHVVHLTEFRITTDLDFFLFSPKMLQSARRYSATVLTVTIKSM
jgi:hypothetical protein